MKKYIIQLCMALVMLNACTKESTSNSALGGEGVGVAGSTARFAIVGNYLYTVDNENLNVFDISNTKKPNKIGTNKIGLDIETIFPRDEKTIFIGSQNGMFIYDVSNPLLIAQLAAVPHFRACDPVVANDNYAFVTLNSEGTFSTTRCWGNMNQLLAYNVTNLNNVFLMQAYNLNKPKGLGLIGENLFVCDDNLLRWFDASNPANLTIKKSFNITSHDIIPLDSSLILVGKNGITQLAFASDSIWFLSNIQTKTP
ncbi:MAG: LVIVD repeat-containing protein [Candidatus Methylacidiphilales bacterium]